METLNSRRILIVDDNEADRMLLTAYLQRLGCHLFYAQNGLEAIEQALKKQPDIILMDLVMPHCNGRDACKVLSQHPKTSAIPIIFISGMTSSEHRVRGLLAGAVDYINKPFDFNEVKLRLAINLRHRSLAVDKEISSVANTQTTKNLHSILFHSARIHLLKSLAKTPLMQELEELTGSNSKNLNAAFKVCVGMTVYEYLREERMMEASVLLRKTQMAVQDIAIQVGYKDAANFSTAFKNRFRFTPREYRQQGKSLQSPSS